MNNTVINNVGNTATASEGKVKMISTSTLKKNLVKKLHLEKE